jgi:ketosteroid isomerase-like protein
MNSKDLTQLHDQYVAAWMRDDREAAMSFWSDDIVMRVAGSNPHSGIYRGKAEVRHNLIDRIYAETSEAEVLGLVDRGIGNDHVFTIVHERFNKADGRVFETKRIVIYRWANQKIVEVLYFDPEQLAADAFWFDKQVE